MTGINEELDKEKLDNNLQYYRRKGNGLVKDFLLVGVGIVLTLAVIGIVKAFV